MPMPKGMKYLIVVAAALALNSCNTFIGLGRDTKEGYIWTKNKIQGTGDGGSQDTGGAPVY